MSDCVCLTATMLTEALKHTLTLFET